MVLKKVAQQYLTVRSSLKEIVDFIQSTFEMKKVAIIVAIDIQGAFYNVRWKNIFEELVQEKVPKHIVKLIMDYFKNRNILYS